MSELSPQLFSNDFVKKNPEKLAAILEQHFHLTFEHEGHQYEVLVDPRSVDSRADRIFVDLVIKNNSDNEEYGLLQCFLTHDKNGISLRPYLTGNHTNPLDTHFNFRLPRVTGLMRATVKELLLQNKVSQWSSDVSLSEASEKMYERLALNPNLTVTKLSEPGSGKTYYAVRENKDFLPETNAEPIRVETLARQSIQQ